MPAAAGATLLAGYEDLRRQALEDLRGGGLGMTLLLTQGMAAWMKACPGSSWAISENVRHQSVTPGMRGDELRREVVHILASMALEQTHAVSV